MMDLIKKNTFKTSVNVFKEKQLFSFLTLLKYSDDPDEITPQPMSGETTSPPITSCHVANKASWDSKSERMLEESGEEGWQSVPEKPSSHLKKRAQFVLFFYFPSCFVTDHTCIFQWKNLSSVSADLQCPWSHQPCPWHMLGHCCPM